MKATDTLLSTIIIGVTLIIMTRCSQSEDLIDAGAQALNAATNNDKELVLTASEQIALSVKQKGSYNISEKEAKKNFESYAKTIHKEKAVKVKALSLKKNKKNGRNLYYEVIFENDKGTGFSLLSADERVDKLLCYSENGSISDTSFNKSLKYCLELVELYVEEQTQKELDIESLASSANQKIKAANKGKVITKALPPFDPDDPNSPWSYDRTDVKNEVTERIKLVPGGWHQESPFNDLLPLLPPDYTDRAYVGCGMIAVSQIMAYHKKPYSNYITAAMWPTMIDNRYTSVELKRLMLDLFNTMNTGYDGHGTSSTISKARDFLNNNGYTAGSAQDYTFDRAWSALSYGPTYVMGIKADDEGHAWVIDGVRITKTTSTDIYTITYNGKVFEASGNSSITSFRTVRYDWEGRTLSDNGWFTSGIFEKPSTGSNYNRNNKIISYIY